MLKYDLAQYLVNLHTLLLAQESAGGLIKSQTLVDEYNRNWGLLKDEIAKDSTDETRPSDNERSSRSEAGTDHSRDQRGRRV